MLELSRPYFLTQGTIVGEELCQPSGALLHGETEEGILLSKPPLISALPIEVTLQKSTPGFHSFYDFFGTIDYGEGVTQAGLGVREGVLRLLPTNDSIEALEKYLKAERVIDISLEKGYLSRLSYEEAIERVESILGDGDGDFYAYMSEQLRDVRKTFQERDLLDREVFQVNEGCNSDIVAFPRDYFDNRGKDPELAVEDTTWALEGRPVRNPIPVRK